jgi:hypothetical protein
MKKVLIGIAVIVVAVGGFIGFRYFQLKQLAAKYKDAKEIASASITKDRSTWNMKIDSVFAAPIDQVWAAMQHPEHSQTNVPDVFRKSDLVKEEGSTKTLQLEVRVLGLPSQTMTAHVTYDPGGYSMRVVTEKGLQDLNVTYTLTALAPDRTLLTYAGTAEEKVSVPLPSESIVEGALRELFIAQVHAIQKEMGAPKPG